MFQRRGHESLSKNSDCATTRQASHQNRWGKVGIDPALLRQRLGTNLPRATRSGVVAAVRTIAHLAMIFEEPACPSARRSVDATNAGRLLTRRKSCLLTRNLLPQQTPSTNA